MKVFIQLLTSSSLICASILLFSSCEQPRNSEDVRKQNETRLPPETPETPVTPPTNTPTDDANQE